MKNTPGLPLVSRRRRHTFRDARAKRASWLMLLPDEAPTFRLMNTRLKRCLVARWSRLFCAEVAIIYSFLDALSRVEPPRRARFSEGESRRPRASGQSLPRSLHTGRAAALISLSRVH